jgi:leucyl aminopeptidase
LRGQISITEFSHSWGQNSIVARINGTSPGESTLIVGAHQDRLASKAPGFDPSANGCFSAQIYGHSCQLLVLMMTAG